MRIFEILRLQSILILMNCPNPILLLGNERKRLLPCLEPQTRWWWWDGGMTGPTMKACATRAACKGAANDQTDQTTLKINLLQGGSDQ